MGGHRDNQAGIRRTRRLKGDRADSHSIRVNQQWGICFRWTAAGPEDVQEMRDRSDFDVILLSADSLETIKRTHSSY
jgi:hypothetical protein